MRIPLSLRVAAGVAILCAAALAAVLVWRAVSAPPPITGAQVDQAVPDVALVDQHGDTVHLSDLQGKVVVIYPFLTDCHEICPMTTAAFIQISQAIHDAGLSDKVALWEVTVDPERDTPARLAAYADLVSADWTMLTGTQANLDRFWSFFGVVHAKQAVASPAPVDWYTHQPETYDVNHTPVLLFIDGSGHERIVLVGTADLGGQLEPSLKAMLNDTGLQNLANPDSPWTVRQALDDIGALLGRSIAAASGS
jgi:cytochrome oxidase Cu insertion factor (SCO1/SenC/PrrC family)